VNSNVAGLLAKLSDMSLPELRLMLLFVDWLNTNKLIELSGQPEG